MENPKNIKQMNRQEHDKIHRMALCPHCGLQARVEKVYEETGDVLRICESGHIYLEYKMEHRTR